MATAKEAEKHDDSPSMTDVLQRARWYVSTFEPRNAEEDEHQRETLRTIDAMLPPPSPKEYCPQRDCILEKGHKGECCDIPF